MPIWVVYRIRCHYNMVYHDIVLNSKVHRANMGPTWVLSAPDGSHVGPMNFAIWGIAHNSAMDKLEYGPQK